MSKIETFYLNVPYLNESRRIQVYLPNNYNLKSRFPVLYLHDGQNIFDSTNSFSGLSWEVGLSIDKFYNQTKNGLIVVAIDNHPFQRFNEYSPWKCLNFNSLIPEWPPIDELGGLGDKYANWLVNDLMRYVNQNYQTKPKDNYIAGSSMGGLISLYIGYKYPNNFKAIGAFSTAIWFSKNKLFDFITNAFNQETYLYLAVGTNETSSAINQDFPKYYLNDTLELNSLVKNLGIKNSFLDIYKDAIHSESEWALQFPNFINWLFKEKLF